MKIEFARSFQQDLIDIHEYIGKKLLNPEAADKMIALIVKKYERLEQFPKMGQILETDGNLPSKYRVLHAKNYLIFYEITEGVVLMHRVIYARRDFVRVLMAGVVG